MPFDRDIESYESAVLLAHIAFGPFRCPANLAQTLALETFRRIEETSWLPHRERLLRAVLLGLRSTPLRALVQKRLRLWLLDRRPHGSPAFNALREWPPSSLSLSDLEDKSNRPSETTLWRTVRDVLWRGLNSEDVAEARLAARTLVQLWAGDVVMGERLADCRALFPIPKYVANACSNCCARMRPLRQTLSSKAYIIYVRKAQCFLKTKALLGTR